MSKHIKHHTQTKNEQTRKTSHSNKERVNTENSSLKQRKSKHKKHLTHQKNEQTHKPTHSYLRKSKKRKHLTQTKKE